MFMPVSRRELDSLGIDKPDFIYIIGDAYVDHSGFGPAIISRVLQAKGYTVAIISQPDSVSQFAKDLISLVVVPNSRSSCSPPLTKQTTMTFLCTSIPQQHR